MSSRRHEWIIIGISGVTCGGKTTLSQRLVGCLSNVCAFHQDQYFLRDDDPRHVRCHGLPHNNYDILSALDMPQMYSDILATIEEASPEAGGAGRAHECSGRGRLRLPGKKFLIVEGFTALNYEPIAAICDLKYYFILEYEECAARRALRLYEPADVPGYFEQCVWPEHLRHRAQIEKDPSVKLLDGTRPDVFDEVIADLRALGARDVSDDTCEDAAA